jgi:hypothetical protein
MNLAIVIPYYKITFFEETLKSLANQTDKRFKVYIGDDASPQSPQVLLNKYKDRVNLKYIRFESNLGSKSLVKQWERCIDLIEDEEWLMILGDDDYIDENYVEEFYNSKKEFQDNYNVIRFSSVKINKENKYISNIQKHPKIEKTLDFLLKRVRSSLSEFVFRKNIVNEIGFKDFPLGWFSDYLAVIEFSKFEVIYSINSSKAFIRVSEISISGKTNNKNEKIKSSIIYSVFLLKNYKEKMGNHYVTVLKKNIIKTILNDKKRIDIIVKVLKYSLLNDIIFFFEIIKSYLKSIFNNIFNKKHN